MYFISIGKKMFTNKDEIDNELKELTKKYGQKEFNLYEHPELVEEIPLRFITRKKIMIL